jgi:hypothetical protein
MFLIRNIEIDTQTQEGKEIFGNYYEQKLYNYLKNNSKYKYEMLTNENKYSLYDFKAEENNKIRIIELRSRIGIIDNYKYEIFHVEKFNKLIELFKNPEIIEIMLIFCHVKQNNYKDYKFYYIDIKDIKPNDLNINSKFGKDMYEIPTKLLKVFE